MLPLHTVRTTVQRISGTTDVYSKERRQHFKCCSENFMKLKTLHKSVICFVMSLILVISGMFASMMIAKAYSPTYGQNGSTDKSNRPVYTITKNEVLSWSNGTNLWNNMISYQEGKEFMGEVDLEYSFYPADDAEGRMDFAIVDLLSSERTRTNFIEIYSQKSKVTSDGHHVSTGSLPEDAYGDTKDFGGKWYISTCQQQDNDPIWRTDKGTTWYAKCTDRKTSGAVTTWAWEVTCAFKDGTDRHNKPLQETGFIIKYSNTEMVARSLQKTTTQTGQSLLKAFPDKYSMAGAEYWMIPSGKVSTSNMTVSGTRGYSYLKGLSSSAIKMTTDKNGNVSDISIPSGYKYTKEKDGNSWYVSNITKGETFYIIENKAPSAGGYKLNSDKFVGAVMASDSGFVLWTNGTSYVSQATGTKNSSFSEILTETPVTGETSVIKKISNSANIAEAEGTEFVLYYSQTSIPSVRVTGTTTDGDSKVRELSLLNNCKAVAKFTVDANGIGRNKNPAADLYNFSYSGAAYKATLSSGERDKLTGLPIGYYTLVETKVPKNFTFASNYTWTLTSSNASSEKVFTVSNKKQSGASLSLVKSSAGSEMTSGNDGYSLEGAEYEVYFASVSRNGDLIPTLTYDNVSEKLGTSTTTTRYVGKFVTDKDGIGHIDTVDGETSFDIQFEPGRTQFATVNSQIYPFGFFFAKEVKSPKGFLIDTELHRLSMTSTNNMELVFESSEQPLNDPINITITKQGEGETDTSLAGTKFRISFYPVAEGAGSNADGYYYSKEDLEGATPERTWVYETKDGVEKDGKLIIDISKTDCFIEGDEFYLDADDVPCFPLGTVTIEEIEPAPGFILEGATLKSGSGNVVEDNLYIAHVITVPEIEGKAITVEADGNRTGNATVFNALEVTDKEQRFDFAFSKYDGLTAEGMPGVRFELKNLDTGEAHTITTDADGKFDSSNSELYIYNTTDTSKWNPDFISNVNGRLLPGNYRLTELACDANEGHQLSDPVDFTVEDEDIVLDDINNFPVPYLSTVVRDSFTNLHVTAGTVNATITDGVRWYYLKAGKKYTIKGILMKINDDGSVEPLRNTDGSLITGRKTFTVPVGYTKSPYEKKGISNVVYNFDATLLGGTKYVVYEYLFEGADSTHLTVNGNEVVTDGVYKDRFGNPVQHTDKNDTHQTGYIPKIGTTAQDKTSGTKLVFGGNQTATVTDTIKVDKVVTTFQNKPLHYSIVGKLIETESGEVVSTVIKDDVTFENSDGNTVTMDLPFDATKYLGKTLVVYEYLYLRPSSGPYTIETYENSDNKALAKHEDLTDVGQTVYVPTMSTQVGTTEPVNNTTIRITDTVSYTNLLKGHDYTLVAEIRDKATGNVIARPAKLTNFTVAGTADELQASGTQDVVFTMNTEGVEAENLVVYEYLYIGKFTSRNSLDASKLVAQHTDINDNKQTFTLFTDVYVGKKDADSDEMLSGAKFRIEDKNGNVIDEWISGNTTHLTKVLAGEYVLIETEAPKGYTVSDPVRFTVGNDKKVRVGDTVMEDNLITMYDTKLAKIPTAGGQGTALMGLSGLILMLGACILGFKRRNAIK